MTTLPHLSLSLMLLTTTAFLLAGLVKGVVGLGLPTLAMALLALAMPPAQAAALLILPSLVTNVWQMRPWPTLAPMTRRLWPCRRAWSSARWAAPGCWARRPAPGPCRRWGRRWWCMGCGACRARGCRRCRPAPSACWARWWALSPGWSRPPRGYS